MQLRKVCIVGIGGAGSNEIYRIKKTLDNKVRSCDYKYLKDNDVGLYVIDADAKALKGVKHIRHEYVGGNYYNGNGMWGDYDSAAKAIVEERDRILGFLREYTEVAIIAGLGGGMGTGATPFLVKMLKDEGINVAAFVIKPFKFEGMKKEKVAEEIIEVIYREIDDVKEYDNNDMFANEDKHTKLPVAFEHFSKKIIADINEWCGEIFD